MAAAAILDFQKFKILTVDPVPSVERSWVYGDLTVFFKMAAVRHLGFVGRLLGPPKMTIWWSLSLRQIWLKSMQ